MGIQEVYRDLRQLLNLQRSTNKQYHLQQMIILTLVVYIFGLKFKEVPRDVIYNNQKPPCDTMPQEINSLTCN
jgi:hypothetical protein